MDPAGVSGVGESGWGRARLHCAVPARRDGGSRGRATHADGGVHPMTIEIPELALVILIGPSASGKSTFARKHFKPTEIITSDLCRALVADDENAQDATAAAFEVLHLIASKRLESGRLTVIDATNVQPESRKSLVELAKKYYCLVVGIVLDVPERVMIDRNKLRTDRTVRQDVIHRQRDQMRRSQRFLKREGFRYIFTLESEEAVNAAIVERKPLWVNRRDQHGPFDIIGDIMDASTSSVTYSAGWGMTSASKAMALMARSTGSRRRQAGS